MKKTILYSLVALATVGLGSCNEDYDDWVSPQRNDAEATKTYVSYAPGSDINSTMPDADSLVHLLKFNVVDTAVKNYTVGSLTINGNTVADTIIGNDICVNSIDLSNEIMKEFDSRASVARAIDVKGSVSFKLPNGEQLQPIGEATGSVKLEDTPAFDQKGYYLLGNFKENGAGFDLSAPVWMNKVSDGVYQAVVTTTSDGDNWYKFYEGSHYSSTNWDEVNAGQMGCENNGDAATHNFVVYTGDPFFTGGVQTPVIQGQGTWIVKLDMNNLTYNVQSPILYLAGNANGWAQTEPLISSDAVNYTGYGYLDNNGFKFSSQKDWNGTNYGQDFSTAGDAANWALPSGDEPGYYKIDLNVETKTMTLTPITTIGIIGDATPNGWGDPDIDMTYNTTDKCWEATNVQLNNGTIKFRANDDWAISWGGTADKLTTNNGANLDVEAGTYDIKLYAWADDYGYVELTKK